MIAPMIEAVRLRLCEGLAASCLRSFGGMLVLHYGPILKGGWLSRQDRRRPEPMGLRTRSAASPESWMR
jgi:hypothetical protein